MSILWLVASVAFLLSLIANVLADTFLGGRIPLIGSFVGLTITHNSGVAFGVAFPPLIQTLLITCALVIIIRFASSSYGLWNQYGFGLIIGGAVANIADRLLDGRVTDYIQVGTFPVFNLADSCITVGAALLIFEMIRRRKE